MRDCTRIRASGVVIGVSPLDAQVIGAKIAYEDRVMEVIDCADFPDAAGTPRGTNGCVVLQGTTTLAGSCTTMFRIFQQLVTSFGLSLQQAVQVCCESPAKIVRLPHVGRLAVGCRADMVALTSVEDLTIERVYVGGVPLE